MKQKLASLLENSIKTCFENKSLETADIPFIEINHSNEASHGDYATNLAMILASTMKTNPRKIASAIVENIQDSENILEKVEIAGPGFVNFFINGNAWLSVLKEVREKGENYGRSYIGRGKRVQVEFVSANPTGPLHIGHARGAAIGDVIANILGATGFSVSREYYINDAGNQMNNLGKSVLYRCRELLERKTEYPKECYQGEYILDIAREIIEKYGPKIAEQEEEKDAITFLTKYAADSILEEIKRDLKDFGVVFDSYFSEKQLHENNGVEKLLQKLMEEGYVYKEDSTLWFKTTNFGDEKDRVVVRANGEPTYFAADIAYHQNKYMRGFDEVIDIWGADHHGYVPRMQAGIQALGIDKDALKIVLVQLVSLLRDGKPVAMSTRAGEFITLKEVVDEVGKDASRYNFLMRRSNSHLDFDLELAKKQSNENPVYYVQYAHARIRSIIRTAEEKGCKIPEYDEADLELLNLPEEFGIMRLLNSFPELVEASAKTLEPHRLTFYANDLASAFHSYYNKNRVVSEDIKLSEARLFLVESIGTVLKNVLSLMGISAPERM